MLLHFTLFQLKVSQLKLLAADAFGPFLPALWALDFVIGHIELSATPATTMPARTEFNLQLQRLQFRLASQYFECELQSVRIHRGQLADPNHDLSRLCSGASRCLGLYGVEYGLRNTQFMHKRSRFASVNLRVSSVFSVVKKLTKEDTEISQRNN